MLCIAHRGASGYAPESTRAAFERAITLGADATESDVQLSADGALVLFHDEFVDRTSDGRGPLADHTLAELRALDIGGWFGAQFAGERILTVDEALDDYLPRIPFALELKDPRVAAPLARLLQARGVGDRVTIRASSWGALLDFRAIYPDLACGLLTVTLDEEVIARSVRRGLAEIYPQLERLTARRVGLAHDAGLRVFGTSLGRRDLLERLFETGADGASCNWPDWITGMRAG